MQYRDYYHTFSETTGADDRNEQGTGVSGRVACYCPKPSLWLKVRKTGLIDGDSSALTLIKQNIWKNIWKDFVNVIFIQYIKDGQRKSEYHICVLSCPWSPVFCRSAKGNTKRTER